jgi:hypothetical protein
MPSADAASPRPATGLVDPHRRLHVDQALVSINRDLATLLGGRIESPGR